MSASPFKFLDSYTREDLGSFFGRERETAELFRQCFVSPILAVYGGSGTGKTSLMQCGLASRFQESDWLPVPVRRSGDMNNALTEAIRALTLTPGASGALGELVTNLYLDHFKPIWFLFDQFEELFIFGSPAECETFFSSMGNMLAKERNVHAIFIVREEYLAELTRYEHLIPGLIENRYRVERLSHRHAMDVTEKLCAANNIPCGEGFSAALVSRLDPESHGVELSYLQVYLDRCWRTRQNEEPFSVALLERIGYVDDLLGAFLDEQVADTPEPQRSECLLKTFVSDQGTKRQLTVGEAHDWVNAIGAVMEPVEAERLLQVFVTKRLLKERDEHGRYELLHDALARQIFQRITRAEQELIEVRQFVQQAHGQFQKRGVKLTANDLTYLRPYRNQLYLKGEVKEFVDRAFGEEERKERRRRLRRNISIGGLLAVLIGTGVYAWKLNQRLQAEKLVKQSIDLADQSMKVLSGDPYIAYLLAERAFAISPTFESERALVNIYPFLYPLKARYRGSGFFHLPHSQKLLIVDHAHDSITMYDAEGAYLWGRHCTGLVSTAFPVVVRDTNGVVLARGDSTWLFDLGGSLLYGGIGAYANDCFGWETGDFALTVGRDSIVYTKAEGVSINPTDTMRWHRASHNRTSGRFIFSLSPELTGYPGDYIPGSRMGGVAPLRALERAFLHVPSSTHALLSRSNYQTTRMMDPIKGTVLVHFSDSLIAVLNVPHYDRGRTNWLQGLDCTPDSMVVSVEMQGDSLLCHRYGGMVGDTFKIDVHEHLERIRAHSDLDVGRAEVLNGRFACVGSTARMEVWAGSSITGAYQSDEHKSKTFLVDLETRQVLDTANFKEPAGYLLSPDHTGLVQIRNGVVSFFDRSLNIISTTSVVPKDAHLYRLSGDRLLFLDSISYGILGVVDMRSHSSQTIAFPAFRLSNSNDVDKVGFQYSMAIDQPVASGENPDGVKKD